MGLTVSILSQFVCCPSRLLLSGPLFSTSGSHPHQVFAFSATTRRPIALSTHTNVRLRVPECHTKFCLDPINFRRLTASSFRLDSLHFIPILTLSKEAALTAVILIRSLRIFARRLSPALSAPSEIFTSIRPRHVPQSRILCTCL